jgi:hypothetical protein
MLIASVRDINSDRVGLRMGLMIAIGAVHGAHVCGRLLVLRDFTLPSPFSSIIRDKRCSPPTLLAEFHKVSFVVPDFIYSLGWITAFFA